MYQVQKIGIFNIPGQIKVNNILFDCGKDMAKKYDLHHWDNTHLKNFFIVFLCECKNSVYLVSDDKKPVATFQTRKVVKLLHFEKLACSPKFSRKGIGSYCMKYIETIAEQSDCEKVCMEVYSPSQHALNFYLHKGYKVCGEKNTLKYSVVKMEKKLQ